MSEYLINHEQETQQLAEKLAAHCPKNKRLIIFLKGELGAGKTTFTRFFLRALGHHAAVKSPTYTLIESYELAKQLIFHLDLYRLQTAREILEMGLYDEFDQLAIWLIEWPERAQSFLPPADILLTLSLLDSQRIARLLPQTPLGEQILKKMETSEH
ncbi:ATPase YjeE family [Candidatus Rickettsiella viridis]|uniref:tRNA threonylcarbamoyladenosine biosynthesis protein TsaE n=1 Tax=Candidatus Rickettsiella viridis TaxID=676208 RepID=A0A2Z5UVD6_9COXI|nr:tRNA (adenosine(37)-N6)-threonylcarbamoyltransferase complex ATPase subunit type 1 TsaE [Candidatus Rickettsiella viridis]BBB14923.1 ATPase YjeE family [Candidatus Rickettsiella viridis]